MEAAFHPTGFFVLRTPLLPFDEVVAWGEDKDRERLRARLRAIVSRPEVREALFLASPDLHEQIALWERDPQSERGKRIEGALVRYVLRMAGRVTPFGFFAGCSVGTVKSQTRLYLAGRERYRRHTRLDMEYIHALAERTEADRDARKSLTYRPNSSLHHGGGRVRYAETRFDGTSRTHHLVTIGSTDPLEHVLEAAKVGATLSDLAGLLVSESVTREEAEEYVNQLVDHQVLVCELSPPVTGQDPVATLVGRLSAVGSTQASVRLGEARDRLLAADQHAMGAGAYAYAEVMAGLQELPVVIDRSRLFQVDMVKPVVSATLAPVVVDEIARGVDLLHRIGGRARQTALGHFREAFERRFGTAEVPLLEALDPDLGVGLHPMESAGDASPLLEGLDLSRPKERGSWTERDDYLLHRVQRALGSGEREIVLTDRDIEALETPDLPPLPDAFAAVVAVGAESEAAIDRGEFTLSMEGLGGPSGANALGRFCHADADLHRWVTEHLRSEEALRPDAIFAEVVHLPEGRAGNILLRPILRGWEIPYLGRSGAPEERQIPVADLRVSIRKGRIVLRSHRHGREVMPRMSTAHHTANGLPVYAFLCALQSEGTTAAAGWNWGPLLSSAFLPRVRSGRLVLSPMRWLLEPREIEAMATGSDGTAALQRIRRERGLPRFLALAESDRALPVDLDNVLSVEALVHLIRGRDRAPLMELPGAFLQSAVSGPEGRFAHELIVPFVRSLRPQVSSMVPAVSIPLATKETRSFPPGSDWLYLKLYTAPSAADRVLVKQVAPLLRELVQAGTADRWFFLRYMDPDLHLRIRVHGERARLLSEARPALEALSAAMHQEGRVWRIQWDTYDREVERYGGTEGIEIAEQVFHADSEAVVEILGELRGEVGLRTCWQLALHGLDRMLEDARFDEPAKLQLMSRAARGYRREFPADKRLDVQLGERFRRERKVLEPLLDPTKEVAPDMLRLLEVFHRRSHRLRPLMRALCTCEREGTLEAPLTEIVLSYLHLFVNRMIRSAARAHELVLYDFLSRIYASRLARVESQGAGHSGQKAKERAQ